MVRTTGDGGVQEGRMEYKDGYNEVHYPGTGATERYHFDDDGLVYRKGSEALSVYIFRGGVAVAGA